MRKILISILIVLLLVVGYLVLFKGLNILGFEVLSIVGIKDKNDELESNLQTLSTLTSVEQPNALSQLDEDAKQLLIAKAEYNDKILYSSNETIETASQTRPYKTEYLWVVLGNHAKKNEVNLKYELKQNSVGISGLYDIYFTVTGSYVSISEFVTSLENDSSLKFKIESFKLIPSNGENLQATFIVKEINVEVDNTTNSNTSMTTSTTKITQQTEDTI